MHQIMPPGQSLFLKLRSKEFDSQHPSHTPAHCPHPLPSVQTAATGVALLNRWQLSGISNMAPGSHTHSSTCTMGTPILIMYQMTGYFLDFQKWGMKVDGTKAPP